MHSKQVRIWYKANVYKYPILLEFSLYDVSLLSRAVCMEWVMRKWAQQMTEIFCVRLTSDCSALVLPNLVCKRGVITDRAERERGDQRDRCALSRSAKCRPTVVQHSRSMLTFRNYTCLIKETTSGMM